jgi:hypothetical protein
MRTAIAVAAVLVFSPLVAFAPMQAWAECAWVLWAGNTVPATQPWWLPWTVKDPGREWLWVRGAVTDSLKACRDEERRHHETTDKMNRAQFSAAPDTTVCRPETMDPRTAKGTPR